MGTGVNHRQTGSTSSEANILRKSPRTSNGKPTLESPEQRGFDTGKGLYPRGRIWTNQHRRCPGGGLHWQPRPQTRESHRGLTRNRPADLSPTPAEQSSSGSRRPIINNEGDCRSDGHFQGMSGRWILLGGFCVRPRPTQTRRKHPL